MPLLKNHTARHVMAVTIATLIAIAIEWHFAVSQEGWIVISALLTSQTTRGTPFKQGLYFFVLIALGVIVGALLTYAVTSMFLLQVIATAAFMIAGMVVFYNRPLQDTSYFTIILLPLVLIIAIMLPAANLDLLASRLLDVLMGAGIGIACQQLIFPVRPYADMVAGLSSILQAYAEYSDALQLYFSGGKCQFQEKRALIVLSLQVSGGMYPEWVYEAGFNPGLRAGYRFFLVNTERVSEVIFSIDSLIESGIKDHMTPAMWGKVAEVAAVNSKLIISLREKLNGKVAEQADMDLMSDVDALEKEAGMHLPGGLDLLGFTQEYAQMTTLVRDLKDIRKLLLQLLLSVP